MEKLYKQILTVLTLILLASPIILITNSAEVKGSPEAADALYSILDNTKNEVDDLFDDIEERNENVPIEDQEKYSEAMDNGRNQKHHTTQENIRKQPKKRRRHSTSSVKRSKRQTTNQRKTMMK